MRVEAPFLVALLGLLAAEALAQPAPQPPTLRLPVGARVRVRPVAAPGDWLGGTLMSADSEGIGLLPENAPPLAGSELRLPRGTVARLEILTGQKRHWLAGLIVGAVAGIALGASMDVDPERCQFDDNYFCSRGEALAAGGLVLGGMGAGVGALVRTDTWLPVALDALGPSAAGGGRIRPEVRASSDGLALGVCVRF
jgi:hypothetical protein